MCWEEEFSKAHPVKIKDTDVFLHGTSSRKYLAIKSTGFLKRKAPATNWGISKKGIYFEKYDEHGTYAGGRAADFTEMTIRGYCETTCRRDHSPEGVILRIKGRELSKLGCPIYADWNKRYEFIRDSEEEPINVDSNAPVLSIIILDKDIPLEYLEVVRRIPFKDCNKTQYTHAGVENLKRTGELF